MKPYLSIVIPCYNEARNIRLGALFQVAHYIQHQTYKWEIIIVDDGSTDESIALIEDFMSEYKGFRLIKNHHQGKANTVVTGIMQSEGDVVLFSDLDQATPLKESEKILPWIDEGYDVVIGSRNSMRSGAPFLRSAMARGFMFLRWLILGLSSITDTQCGFKAFKRSSANKIFQRMNVYKLEKNRKHVGGSQVTAGFDVELLFIARKLGYKIKEVPVEWHYVETRRVDPIRDSISSIQDLIKIRWNNMTGKYE